MIDKELLAILACPACKADVELKNDKICCVKCGKKYPIRNGIPVMLIEEVGEYELYRKTEEAYRES